MDEYTVVYPKGVLVIVAMVVALPLIYNEKDDFRSVL
ncbi:MAG: hypothetical protein ACJAUO_001887 [Sediminicola sp.]|jgi:hypothetical protein